MRDRDYLFAIKFHQKEQWDLNRTADVIPFICVSYETPDRSKRIFCLWRYGIQIGNFLLTPHLARIGKRSIRWGKIV